MGHGGLRLGGRRLRPYGRCRGSLDIAAGRSGFAEPGGLDGFSGSGGFGGSGGIGGSGGFSGSGRFHGCGRIGRLRDGAVVGAWIIARVGVVELAVRVARLVRRQLGAAD